MAELTPAAHKVAYKEPCEFCGGPLYSRFFTDAEVPGILGYTLRRSLIRMRRELVHTWHCEPCDYGQHASVAMRPKAPDARPIRQDRVNGIRRLRRAGYRFFEWEKPYVELG